MLNVSEMAKDMAIVDMECEWETVPGFRMVPFLMALSDGTETLQCLQK